MFIQIEQKISIASLNKTVIQNNGLFFLRKKTSESVFEGLFISTIFLTSQIRKILSFRRLAEKFSACAEVFCKIINIFILCIITVTITAPDTVVALQTGDVVAHRQRGLQRSYGGNGRCWGDRLIAMRQSYQGLFVFASIDQKYAFFNFFCVIFVYPENWKVFFLETGSY